MLESLNTWVLAFAVALSCVAAVIDLRTGLIPNRLVLVGALAAPVYLIAVAVVVGAAGVPARLGSMVAGALLVSLVPLLLYRFDAIGGGDVKLLAVLGMLLGPSLGLQAELFAFVAAALYGPIQLIMEGKLGTSMRSCGQLLRRLLTGRKGDGTPVTVAEMTSLRFGPAIMAGTLWVAVQGGGS